MENKISFGASTWIWVSPFTTKSVDLFPKIKAMGFDSVEIPIEDPDLIDGLVVKKALIENGLQANVCGAFGPTKDFTHDDVKVHDNCFKYIQKCFEFCNLWESSFLGGPMYSAVGKARMVSNEQRKIEWERAVLNLNKVCLLANNHGLSIAIEPLNRFETDLINTVEDVMRLIKDINHANAKVLLDGFHMCIEEKNIANAIKEVGDKLIHVQVSENNRGIPGSGLTPWDELKIGLDSIGYNGNITIESFTPENKELAAAVCIWKNLANNQDEFASQGIQFLKKHFNN